MNDNLLADFALLAYAPDNQTRDLLVAAISIGLGLNILYAVLSGNGRCFELASVRTLERGLGASGAKVMLIGIGSICVLLGGYLIAQPANRKTVSNAVRSTEATGVSAVPPRRANELGQSEEGQFLQSTSRERQAGQSRRRQ